MTPKRRFGSCSELGLKVCWRNKRWKQATATLLFLCVRLIYDDILLYELERGVKEPSWFPRGVLTMLVMLECLLVFLAVCCLNRVGLAVKWALPWRNTCLHFGTGNKWLRLFLQGLLLFFFFSIVCSLEERHPPCCCAHQAL